jgi:hypothetical protein
MSSPDKKKKSAQLFAAVKKDIADLAYPPNYDFDPETLKPTGDLKRRVECLNETAPEMMQGSGEFLDVGSNKGFLPLHLRRQYKNLTGIEPIKKYVDFSKKLVEAHESKNIDFLCVDWKWLEGSEPYDVVYCGGVHHHGFNDCVKANTNPFDFLYTVAEVARLILVIDGPWHLNNPKHNTAGALAEQNKWSAHVRTLYTIEEHARFLINDFELVRTGPSGTGDRQIVVFRRRR